MLFVVFLRPSKCNISTIVFFFELPKDPPNRWKHPFMLLSGCRATKSRGQLNRVVDGWGAEETFPFLLFDFCCPFLFWDYVFCLFIFSANPLFVGFGGSFLFIVLYFFFFNIFMFFNILFPMPGGLRLVEHVCLSGGQGLLPHVEGYCFCFWFLFILILFAQLILFVLLLFNFILLQPKGFEGVTGVELSW